VLFLGRSESEFIEDERARLRTGEAGETGEEEFRRNKFKLKSNSRFLVREFDFCKQRTAKKGTGRE
jgi:hypothetical protein